MSSTVPRLRRVLREALDEAIAARALARGLITSDALERARAAADEDGRSLLECLRATGVDPGALVAIEQQLACEELAAPSALRVKDPPPEVAEAASDPVRVLGDLVLVTMVGRGGAGEVWKAWDRQLDRWVAVKLPLASVASAAARQRFEREATAVARLAHPNIVPVFAAGTDRGRPFLVMPFIEGHSLAEAKLPPRRALEVMRIVALAVDHAHRHGVIHRDLKPGNIMLGAGGAVFVLDFGLVFMRDEARSAMTRDGDLLGTAGYMAPEQATASDDARLPTTDVYGLGATLSFLLTGRAPNPDTPQDLPAPVAAVLARALAPDPRRRYATAAALADELGRLLDGVAPVARPPGFATRVMRALGRRPLTAGATLLVLAALAMLGGWARMRAQRNDGIDALRQVARVSLEAALRLRRAGQAQGMRQLLPPLMEAHARVTRLDPSAEADYLVGRMLRALMDDEGALGYQQRALVKDPAFAPALYERAVLLSRRYRRRLAAALPATGTASLSPALEAVERGRPELAALREAVVRDFRRLRGLPLAPADVRTAEGLLAYHEARHADARRLLAAAVALEPLSEDAWETLARAEEAQERWAQAEAVYTRALTHDRGYLPLLLGRCNLRALVWQSDRALEDARLALANHPDSVEAWRCQGFAHTQRAHEWMMTGRDATAVFAAAEHDFGEALRRDPDSSPALLGRGVMYRYRARAHMRHGGAPGGDLVASARDLGRAALLDPIGSPPWAARARTLTLQAEQALARGEDPTALFEAAEADLARAMRAEPTAPAFHEWRGDLRRLRALDLIRRGQDPAAMLESAETDLQRAAIKGEPWVYYHRGSLRALRAGVDARRGVDPLPRWAAAEADLSLAIERLHSYPDAWTRRAAVRQARAHWMSRGRHHRPDRAAAADLAQALRIDAGYAEALALAAVSRPGRLAPPSDLGRPAY